MRITIEQVKVINTVVTMGTLRGAAARLSYTPSGLSKVISGLEWELGFPLFVRSATGMMPTPELEEILPKMQALLMDYEALCQGADRVKGVLAGQVRIGVAYSTFFAPLAEVIDNFSAAYPGIRMELVHGVGRDLLAQVMDLSLDLCIISYQPGEYEWHKLGEDEILAMIPAKKEVKGLPENLESFPLSLLESVRFIESYPGKETDCNRLIKEKNIRLGPTLQAADTFAAFSMVEAGLGVSLTNWLLSIYESDKVKILPLDPPVHVDVGVAILDSHSLAAHTFLNFLLESSLVWGEEKEKAEAEETEEGQEEEDEETK